MTDTDLFQQKAKQWREYLGGNSNDGSVDANSIYGLLLTLYWEMGAYEAYVAICQNNPSSPLATLLFGNLTAFNYIQIQALRIRRLCEPYTDDGGKDNSIYSLRRLVDEMKQERKSNRFTKANTSDSLSLPSIFTANLNKMLDDVCDKNGLLKKSLAGELDKRLLIDKNVELKNIIDFVDKYTAHSSSQSSRTQANSSDIQLRVAEIKKVISGLTEAFYICDKLITFNSNGLIKIGWDNQIANLSQAEQQIVSKTYDDLENSINELKNNAYKLLSIQ